MKWSPQQREALRKALSWRKSKKPYFTLAGYAGTGKSTLAAALSEDVGGPVYYAAYTGKAAHVLRKKGVEASTIHKLIYLPRDKCDSRLVELEKRMAELLKKEPRDPAAEARLGKQLAAERENLSRPDFYLNTESPLLDAKLLVLDEYSMVDRQTGRDLLSFGCPILALGDPGQLPPVKGAQFFDQEPDVLLTEIHRQAEGSPIIRLSREVREGRALPLGEHGTSSVRRMRDLTDKQIEKIMLGTDQILVGLNATRRAWNREVRRLLGRTDVLPVTGDKVVCLRNNPREGLLNGQTWVVERSRVKSHLELRLVNDDGDRVSCLAHRECFEQEVPQIDPRARREANEFDYGYAMTVHKSQGSQWDSVVLYDEWRSASREQWLYTGITRAAEKITVLRD